MGLINFDAKEIIFEKMKNFDISKKDIESIAVMRQKFGSYFTKERIEKLTPECYFPGLGKQEECIGYQLEWGTRPLGSIKGGSMAKYGAKDQFREIKKLFINLTSFTDKRSIFYDSQGNLTQASNSLIAQSSKIRGMKSGCTVLGKLLSIYYPDTFIPIFTHQNYLLSILVNNFSNDIVGLESFFRNNYLFLRIKEGLMAEPLFMGKFSVDEMTNDLFCKILYSCFPPQAKIMSDDAQLASGEDEKIEALETEHYQKLIHRNFKKLFKNLHYYDQEVQDSQEGHYPTEDAGIMDFLCLDDHEDFVVMELKRRGTDETVGQICRYIGWVKENLAKKDQKVHGLIVAERKDPKLDYALKAVPNVVVMQMTLNVSINGFED